MDRYAPPLDAITLALEAAGLDEILALPAFGSTTRSDVDLALKEFGRFAAEVIAPTNRIGDRKGASYDPATGSVTLPAEIAAAYRGYVETGWGAAAAPVELGGGGMPGLVGLAIAEQVASANMALSLNPTLTHGSIDLLETWGTDAQRATYLPRLVSGEWTGTMDLTEPEAGSDVGAVRTKAVPTADGRWAITGSKIFITWGEHDVADNIIHFVLARTPGSPAGTKGISLFVVPKFLTDETGRLGECNAVRCTGIEHKLGIHASPTCMIDFDGATGELIGPEHNGMAAMFTMMNAARLQIGLQGAGLAERSYQQALAFARERVQGQVAGAPPGTPIIEHPDVTRMLLTMATGIDAQRQLLYATAAATDLARHHPDPDRAAAAEARVDLLTPITKAWVTDEGVRLTSLGIQVHGGMGFIEETGAAQHLRDARIAPIYEGTNGIQAIDLVNRKVHHDRGAAMDALLTELETVLPQLAHHAALATTAPTIGDALTALRSATATIVDADPRDRLAAATTYLDLAAVTIAAALLAQQALRVSDAGTEAADATAGRLRFFATQRLAPAIALTDVIRAGAADLHSTYL